MIETNYDYSSGYHDGSVVVQDALAFLGVFKQVEEVSERYRFENFKDDVDAEEVWEAFDAAELEGVSYSTRKYKYEKAWREWRDYCEEHRVHPAFADPQDIENHISEQAEVVPSLGTVYMARFRPLYLWYRWMQWHPDYDHRYNPCVMAVLLEGAVYDVWALRLGDRKSVPENYE